MITVPYALTFTYTTLNIDTDSAHNTFLPRLEKERDTESSEPIVVCRCFA
jgi:hypothetical protein